jgi:hypothetical protein
VAWDTYIVTYFIFCRCELTSNNNFLSITV